MQGYSSTLYLCSFVHPGSQWYHSFSFALFPAAYSIDLVFEMFGIVLIYVMMPLTVYIVRFIVGFYFWFLESPFSIEICATLSWFPSRTGGIFRGVWFYTCCLAILFPPSSYVAFEKKKQQQFLIPANMCALSYLCIPFFSSIVYCIHLDLPGFFSLTLSRLLSMVVLGDHPHSFALLHSPASCGFALTYSSCPLGGHDVFCLWLTRNTAVWNSLRHS